MRSEPMTRDAAQDAALAARWIEEGRRAGAPLVEVFVKSARSVRCRIGDSRRADGAANGASHEAGVDGSIDLRAERGLALRLWMPDGREGFLHLDVPDGRSARDTVASCLELARRSRPGPLPRLPSAAAGGADASSRAGPVGLDHRPGRPALPDRSPGSRGPEESPGARAPRHILPRDAPAVDRFAPSSGPCSSENDARNLEGRLAGIASAIGRAAARPGRSALALLDGWAEIGLSRTVVMNSAGGCAGFEEPFGSIGVWVAGGATGGGMWEISSLWHTVAVDDIDRVDAQAVVDAAAWRAAASIGGAPRAGRARCAVLLEPRSAAAWLRHLLPVFRDGERGLARDSGPLGRTSGTRPSPPPIPHGPAWLNVVDDPRLSRQRPLAVATSFPSDGAQPALTAAFAPPESARTEPDISGGSAGRKPGASERVAADLRGSHPACFDGEGRLIGPRALILNGAIQASVHDSCDAGPGADRLGPMRRDSYRDRPHPAPMHPHLLAGSRTREEMLAGLEEGLFVTALAPRSAPGTPELVADVRGIWIEKGRAVGPVGGMSLRIPALEGLARIVEAGSDAQTDHHGIPVRTPSILFEDVELAPL